MMKMAMAIPRMTTPQPPPMPAPTAAPMDTPREGDGVDVAELLEVCVDETEVDDAVWSIMVVDIIDGVPAYVVRSVTEAPRNRFLPVGAAVPTEVIPSAFNSAL